MTLSPCPSDESPRIGAQTRVCVCRRRDTHRFPFSWGSRRCSAVWSFPTLSCLALRQWVCCAGPGKKPQKNEGKLSMFSDHSWF